MTTKTKSPKVAAQTSRSASGSAGKKPKPPAPESAASARLRREARAAVAANLAELDRTAPAPGSAPGPVGHNEQGGEPREPQKPQPDQQQHEQTREQPVPAPEPKPAKKAKAGAKNSAAKPKAEKVIKPKAATPKPPKVKRLSCIDAAAQIIGKDPTGCRDLIAEMGQRKLWSSPGGKTPDASLYAAIIREIAAKGTEARFRKVDRGLFVANSAGRSGGKGA